MHEVKGFVKAAGQRIVNGRGQEVLLRGVGFGSWLLPEGYMWRFPEQGDRPRRIERMIRDLVGERTAKEFWEIYYRTYVAEKDIARVAAEGFNSVRLPINSRFLFEGDSDRYHEGHLAMLDQVIDWCEKYRLYVILDLHGAPGGQTGTNIDDSANDLPELFLHEENKQRTVAIWRMLAERYRDRWIVAGYDLLNEPLPEWFSAYNDQVMPLYQEIIRVIREVDSRHMIILEGVHWGTDWSIFREKIDGNLMLQFHKYWNSPDTGSIRKFLDKRSELDVPIFMGEGGENNVERYTGAFRLYEDHAISWNFWTWKKMDCTNSPFSVAKPQGWDRLVAYLQGGDKPSAPEVERILREYLQNLDLDRCTYHPQVVNALLLRPPVRIPAVFYGYKGPGVSFHTNGFTTRSLGFRDEDGTDIRFTSGERTTANFQHGGGEDWSAADWMHVRLQPEEWLAYTVDHVLDDQTRVPFALRVCACGSGDARLEISIHDWAVESIPVSDTVWHVVRTKYPYRLQPGANRIVIKALDRPAAVEWIRIGE